MAGRRRRSRWAATRILYTRTSASPEGKLLFRLVLVVVMLAAVVTAFWLDREGLRDNLDGEISFIDVVYFTMVTVTTVGYGDIAPVSDQGRLIDALLVTPIRVFIWFIFLGTAYEFVIQRVREDLRMARLKARLDGHVVICGYGHCGSHAARELAAKGWEAEEIVVIDSDEEAVKEAAEAGFIGVRGDAAREAVMQSVNVHRAAAVLICTGRDDTNILIVLTVRNLASAVRIVASVREGENAKLIRQSGADVIVAPGTVGGYLMADAAVSQRATDYMIDLMTARGEVAFRERPAGPAEIGRRIGEIRDVLVVRVFRGGRALGFWQADERIAAGDLLLVIERNAGAAADEVDAG